MPLFKVDETRYIHTEHVADIKYWPSTDIELNGKALPPTIPHLKIKLRNDDEIELSGEDADTVWAAFNEARKVQSGESERLDR
ncbi:MAG: hypothetical protein ABSG13_06540 [Bryobacteraceae bacterium]|jgi:hypothetical protein